MVIRATIIRIIARNSSVEHPGLRELLRDMKKFFELEMKWQIFPNTRYIKLGIMCDSQRKTEKSMAPHSSTTAWKIPWTEEPGGLQSMGSLRVRHDWATSLSLLTFIHWKRKWQPTPMFLPGESQGRGSLVGCCLWGHTESDMTKVT